MVDEQKTTTDEKQAQKKRIMCVLGVGFAALLIFYFLANGITSLLVESSAMKPIDHEQAGG